MKEARGEKKEKKKKTSAKAREHLVGNQRVRECR